MKALNFLQNVRLAGQTAVGLQQMMARQWWSQEKITQYQIQKIQNILAVAQAQVGLYQTRSLPDSRDLKDLKQLEEIPILKKSDLLDSPIENLLNKSFKKEDLIVSKSSGSTGKALDVYYDLASYNLFIMAGLRLYTMAFRYMPWHSQTYIYTSPYPLNSLFGLYPLNFISTLSPIDEAIQKIRQAPPDILVCYPSHLRSIVDKMTAEDFKIIKPKVINVNSEMSSANEREYLARKFNAFVFDDYSSEELTRIASQCQRLSYHLFEDINYMEVVDDNGRPVQEGTVGNLVGTNLHNIGMPLIRYSQGDRGAIRSGVCACGRKFRLLEKLEGRKNDAFILSDGETISSGFLLDLTYGVFLNYPGAVNSFCLVQEEPEKWILELVPGQAWSSDLDTKISSDLKTILKRPSVEIFAKIVTEVRKTKSGKANPIVSLVNKKL